MNAGHDLDTVVATKVMGWGYDGVAWRDEDVRYGDNSLPRFSTEPGYMWMVVDRMERLGYEWGMHSEGTKKDGGIVKHTVVFGGGGDKAREKELQVTDESIQMAICLAALKVMEKRSGGLGSIS
jgi:hypothetical protein